MGFILMVSRRLLTGEHGILQFWIPLFSPGKAIWRLEETCSKLQPLGSLGSFLCSGRAVPWEAWLRALLLGTILKAVEIHYR